MNEYGIRCALHGEIAKRAKGTTLQQAQTYAEVLNAMPSQQGHEWTEVIERTVTVGDWSIVDVEAT